MPRKKIEYRYAIAKLYGGLGVKIGPTLSPYYWAPGDAGAWLARSGLRPGRYAVVKRSEALVRERRRYVVQRLEKVPIETITVQVEE